MTRSKNTRRAFLASVLSIVLCLMMLVGSTFAWFTDTASTGVNKIVSGTLDVALEMKDGENWVPAGDVLNFKTADGRSNDKILWEPGCTYALPEIRVVNNGNLALKYKIVISGFEGDAKLSEAIEWTGLPTDEETSLAAEAKSAPIAISGHMKETAGNEYQNLTITGISIVVYATQDTVEYDSFGNQYDANAIDALPVVVKNQAELTDAINNATTAPVEIALPKGEVELPSGVSDKDITFSGDKDTVIDATESIVYAPNCDYTFEGLTMDFGNKTYNGIAHASKVLYKDCTIKGLMTGYAEDVIFINCTFENPADYSIWTWGTKNMTFIDCTFNTCGKAILVYNEAMDHTANVTVTNCTFNDDGTYTSKDKAAVETGILPGSGNVYNITMTDCTVTGFEPNNSTSNFWGNKNSMDTNHLNVIIDGVEAY